MEFADLLETMSIAVLFLTLFQGFTVGIWVFRKRGKSFLRLSYAGILSILLTIAPVRILRLLDLISGDMNRLLNNMSWILLNIVLAWTVLQLFREDANGE